VRLQGAALVALLILTSAAATKSFAADPGVLHGGGAASICSAGFSPSPAGYNPKTGGVAYTCTEDSAPKCAAGLALEANAAGVAGAPPQMNIGVQGGKFFYRCGGPPKP